MLINIILAIIAYKSKSLSFKGTMLAFILGIIVYCLCIDAYMILFFYFVLITTIEIIVLGNKRERRSYRQVLSNFIFALISLILYIIFEQHNYFVLYCSMLSVSICDTVASTIGTRFAKKVYSITKFKIVEKGVSGGVSICGSFSGVLGSVTIALMYCLLFFKNIVVGNILLIILLGVSGMLIDSILGDLLQKKYYCQQCQRITDNEMCCGNKGVSIGAHLLTNSQVNIISEGLMFVFGLLIL